MKKIILLLLISFTGYSQKTQAERQAILDAKKDKVTKVDSLTPKTDMYPGTQFIFTKEGFTDFVVTKCEGKTQQELYKKALDWIMVAYNNPKEVLRGQIENDYVRFEGTANNIPYGSLLGMPTVQNIKYQIEISVKNGKYKFDVTNVSHYQPATQYTIGQWVATDLTSTKSYFKENGEVRSICKKYPAGITDYFNGLNKSLYDFITTNETATKKDDWD